MTTRLNNCFHVWILIVAGTLMTTVTSAEAQTAQDNYALAANHYARGNWNESVVAFDELIRRHPDTDEAAVARFFLAEVKMQQGEFGKAYLAFQIFLRENPTHEYGPRATFRMGEAAYRTGNRDVAIRMLEEFIKKNPHHDLTEFALPYLGEMRLKQDEPQLAQRAFETALRIFPTSTISNSSRLGLAKALQMQGNEAEATRFYQFLLTQQDDNLVGESHLQIGIISFGHLDYETAENHLRKAISKCELKNSQAEATYWLARTHIELQDYGRAIELLNAIVDVQLPEKIAVAALFDGAVAATKTGKDKLALRWLARLRDTYPHNAMVDDSIRMAIDIHQRQGDSDEALVLIYRFRKEHPNSPMRAGVLEAEGRSHYAAKRYKQMIATFEVLLEEIDNAEPVDQANRANWHYLKSLGHLGLGDFEQAEIELARIAKLGETKQLAPLVQIARATARFGMEDYASAIENYRGFLRLSKNGGEQKRARAELVICLAETSRWDEAASAFEDLKTHHEGDSLILSTAKFLAERSYYEKQTAHAERWFTLMARPGNPKETIARGLSGLAWIKMESKDSLSANDVFERLLNEFPDSKFSGEAAMARAKFLEDQKDFQLAAQTYGLVIRQFSSTDMAKVAKLRRAYALQILGGRLNLEESERLLTEYLALASGNPLADEALYQLGWVLQDLGRADECLVKFAELVESKPQSKYWSDAAYRVVQNAVAKHDLATARPLVAKLLARPDTPSQVVSRVLFVQGQIAAEENQWAEVTISMRDLVERTDNGTLKAKAEYWLAESLYRQKNYAAALAIFSRLIPAVNQLDAKLEPWVLLRTAQCHGCEGSWDSAIEIAKGAKSRFPVFDANYEFDFVIGRGLEDAGKLIEARVAFQAVVDSANGGSTETAAIAQWRIGETYFHQEEFVNAIKSYHKVDSLFTYQHWRSAALFQAGKCQENLKNDKHAIKLYTQLIESFPESDFAADARKRLDRLTAQAKAMGAKTRSQPKPSQSRR